MTFEMCPGCGGVLEYQTQADLVCRSCESVFCHEKRGERNLLWSYDDDGQLDEIVARQSPADGKYSQSAEGDPTRYEVFCEECGVVSFDVTDDDWFGNAQAAGYYAGYHDGKEHGGGDRNLSIPKQVGEEPPVGATRLSPDSRSGGE